jgi:recombination protein RecT
MSTALATVENKIFDCEQRFLAVNTYKLNFKREASFALQLLAKNDFLLKTAQNNPASLEDALSNLAAIGISLNPATKESYLVPRSGEVCLDISAIGLVKLATDSGSILWGQAKLVYANDEYENQGVSKEPLHKYKAFGDRGAIVGGYVVVKTHTGDFLIEEMSLADCHAIRDRSEAWKAYKAGKTKSCPWATDEGEMIKKTILKRASKYWPKSDRVDEAVNLLNSHEGIDFSYQNKGAHIEQPSSDVVADEKAFKNVRDLLAFNKKTEEGLLKYINGKFKTAFTSIEEFEPIHLEETYRAIGGKK